jgi:tetratricopeptide (TPR) repeat protein
MLEGTALPEGHPPVERLTLPDEIKAFIANLAAEAQQQPTDKAAWARLAEVQSRAARIDRSYYQATLTSYSHLLELDPDDPDALRGLANTHYDLGEYREALPHFEKYLAMRPDDPSAQTDLATVRLHLGDKDAAIAGYRKVIAADASFVQAHYNLGIALHQLGDDDGALQAFRHAKEVATDEVTRKGVDRLIERLGEGSRLIAAAGSASGRSASGSRGGSAAGDSPEAASTDSTASGESAFQEAVGEFFRNHEVMGPKVVTVEWVAPMKARVLIRDFPMAAMPPFARTKLQSSISTVLREAKEAANTRGIAEVAIVDASTRQVTETIAE